VDGDLPQPGTAKQQTAAIVADINNDGIEDIVIGSRRSGPSVIGYTRTRCDWERFVIEAETLPIEAGGDRFDIDRDGDLDIVFGGDSRSADVWWWENPYPDLFNPAGWTRRKIKSGGGKQHHDQIFGDFDGDGDGELAFWNQGVGSLFVAEIPVDPKNAEEWYAKPVFSHPGKSEGLAKADIDLDGRLDIVGGGCWFGFSDERGFESHLIDENQRYSRVAVGQLVKGGRPEVVFVVGDGTGRLRWYQWEEGVWTGYDLLGFDVDHGHTLQVADLDQDGHLDIFSGEMRLNGKNRNAKLWVFYGDGTGNFQKTKLTQGFGIHEGKVADLDGDGDLDIVGKPYNWKTPRVDLWINEYRQETLRRWKRHVVDPEKPWRSIFIETADMDLDGHIDIVTGAWWYRNPQRSDAKWERMLIGSPLNNIAKVEDLDEDGDHDVLGTKGKGSEKNADFVWARNDGSGHFQILDNIPKADGDFLQGIAVGRFQKKERKQILLSWHAADKGIQMLTVPSDPALASWSWYRLSSVSQDEALSSGDIDGDGDLDVFLGTVWLRNDGTDWQALPINPTDGAPDRNQLADIDRDGNLDAVVGFEINKLAWYRQGTPSEAEWHENVISTEIKRPMSLDVVDMDGDQDVDIVAGEHNLKHPKRSKLMVFENVDGYGACWRGHLVHVGDEHHDGAKVVDIDGDGDLDIVSIGWSHNRVLLYENLSGNMR
jgi:hypothetical protein